MTDIVGKMNEAAAFIRSRTDTVPTVGIVLGTGLGRLADVIDIHEAIPYGDIPGFVSSTVESHDGRLLMGALDGCHVVAMQGRFHAYEGYSMQEITFPVRVMKALGARSLVISNAAGGLNPEFCKGDLVLITDHINLLGGNPLAGVNEPGLGPRFVDMLEPYSGRLMELSREVAVEKGMSLREGVYVALQGPTLETRAEYRFLRMIGADMVGMSTVPETIVAVQMGMEVLGVTIISDMCIPDMLEPADINDIIATCTKSEPSLTALVRGVVSKL